MPPQQKMFFLPKGEGRKRAFKPLSSFLCPGAQIQLLPAQPAFSATQICDLFLGIAEEDRSTIFQSQTPRSLL